MTVDAKNRNKTDDRMMGDMVYSFKDDFV